MLKKILNLYSCPLLLFVLTLCELRSSRLTRNRRLTLTNGMCECVYVCVLSIFGFLHDLCKLIVCTLD